MPTATDRLYFVSEYFYINSKSQHQDAAAEFLDFITSPEEQQKYLGSFSSISVAKGVDYSSDHVELDRTWRDIFSNVSATYANGDQAFPLDVTTEYWRVINKVATDDMSPAEAVKAMQTFVSNRKT
jgi:raffinose/stachyose/melibiose transport system substrate-binding protein